MTRGPTLWRHRRGLLAALIVVWIGAFAATHWPAEHLPELHASDTLLHGLGYAVLATMFWLTLTAYGGTWPRRAVVTFTVLVLYAVIDEITQPLVNRTAALDDVIADSVGALVGIVVCESVTHIAMRRNRRSFGT